MLSIYVHIPFCHSKCAYCDFYSVANHQRIPHYVDALCHEIVYKSSKLPPSQRTPQTIYFGGGTPSILSSSQFRKIFDTISKCFDLSSLTECTIECNPEDVFTNHDFFEQLATSYPRLKNALRFSLGVQSFSPDALHLFHRRHTAQQNLDAVHTLSSLCHNISVDIIYAYPGQSLADLKKDLDIYLSLPVQHISTYLLSFEPHTLLALQLQRGELGPVSDELAVQMYEYLSSQLASAGFHRYEISNFARKGFHSRHNSMYWTCSVPYIGFGPGAHSFNGSDTRSYNPSNLKEYLDLFRSNPNDSFEVEEHLTPDNQYDEYVMSRLRTSDGISIPDFKKRFGDLRLSYLLQQAQSRINNQQLSISNDFIRLNASAIMLSDAIFTDLMA